MESEAAPLKDQSAEARHSATMKIRREKET